MVRLHTSQETRIATYRGWVCRCVCLLRFSMLLHHSNPSTHIFTLTHTEIQTPSLTHRKTNTLTHTHTQKNKLIIIMVGLPGRGKTFLCNKLKRCVVCHVLYGSCVDRLCTQACVCVCVTRARHTLTLYKSTLTFVHPLCNQVLELAGPSHTTFQWCVDLRVSLFASPAAASVYVCVSQQNNATMSFVRQSTHDKLHQD